MKISLAWVKAKGREDRLDTLAAEYLARVRPYAETEMVAFKSSATFFAWVDGVKARMAPVVVVLDGRGKQFSSEALAEWVGRQRDEGQQRVIFAVGPADGWTETERNRAGLLLSLGALTLPHELARVVVCEQIYRAFTILAGHPYHRE